MLSTILHTSPQKAVCQCCGVAAASHNQVLCANHRPARRTPPRPSPRSLFGHAELETGYEASLRAHLAQFVQEGHLDSLVGPPMLEVACEGLSWAIDQTWTFKETPPLMSAVFGDRFSSIHTYPACGECRPDLVINHQADANEYYDGYFGSAANGHNFAVLHDPTAPRSLLRILFPGGDRTVIILPPEFDGI